ncbi:MAG: hypothetical protein OSJ31_05120 [Alistipes sp.]|nr:hypothetical protein [Alistipes sp.]
MKRAYLISICALTAAAVAWPSVSSAQANKQVEVTKAYIPQVGDARKPAIEVDMTDTVKLRPEIDYTITPRTWRSSLQVRDFEAARANFWDYERPKKFFARLGAGYPLTTLGDLYFTTHNPKVGYAGAYVNHEGDFEPRSTAFGGERLTAARSGSMRNRIGARGGLFVGRHTAAIDIDYRYDMFHRYAVAGSPRLDYGDAGGAVRFGDDFADLSRVNFDVELHGRFWRDIRAGKDTGIGRDMFSVGGSVRLARDFSGNEIEFELLYDQWSGCKALSDYADRQAGASLGYSRRLGNADLSVGVGYRYDKVTLLNASHFVMPRLRLAYSREGAAFAPFVELDTRVESNNYRSLAGRNPYIGFDAMTAGAIVSMPATRSYDLSGGFEGVAARGRLSYRASVGVSFMRDRIFWYNYDFAWFGAEAADDNRITAAAEIEYRPTGAWTIGGGVKYHADNTSTDLLCCEPKVEGVFRVRYTHSRFTIAAAVEAAGRRHWSVRGAGIVSGEFTAPATADVSLWAEYAVTRRLAVFAEGRNLANTTLYDWANYYRNSINFRAGVKIDF